MRRTHDAGARDKRACRTENPIGYLYWHSESARRIKAGERQVRCDNCGLYVFPKWPADREGHHGRNVRAAR
jgi:hypothetical protein